MRHLGYTAARIFLILSVLIFSATTAVSIAAVPGLIVFLLLGLAFFRGRWRGSGYVHGTARLASLLDLARGGMLSKDGIVLGRASFATPPSRGSGVGALLSPRFGTEMAVRLFLAGFRPRRGDDSIVRLQKFTMVASFAGTGRGKGVSVVVPNALAYPHSVVILDIKGEVHKLTAHHRRTRLRNRVLVLDPAGLSGEKSASLNPLDFIDANADDFLDQARDLADALVVVKGTEHDPHWNASAILVLTAIIAFVCACEPDPAKRTLRTVRTILSGRKRYFSAVKVMQTVQGFHGVVRELGHQLTWYRGKELSSVLATVQRNTEWMDSPAVAATMGPSSFHPSDLKAGNLTLYLILPAERLSSLAGLMRLWMNTLLRVSTRGVPDESRPILFLLDEIGNVGKLQALEDAVTLMRGWGIRLWFIFQSIGQMRKTFGEHADIILDNVDTQQYFGINAFESADAISKRAGDATVVVESVDYSESHSQSATKDNGERSRSASRSFSEQGRPLLRPDEVIRMRDDMSLVFHRNMPVAAVQLLRYYDAPEFQKGGTGQSRDWGLRALIASLGFLVGALFWALILLLPSRPGAFPTPQPLPGRPSPYVPSTYPQPWPGDPGKRRIYHR